MSAIERARSTIALTKGSCINDEGAAGVEVIGSAEVVVGSAEVVAGGGRVVVGGALDISDTRLIGLGVLPEFLQRL
jgi:hypothetical protein